MLRERRRFIQKETPPKRGCVGLTRTGPPGVSGVPSVCDEAIEQASAPGGFQVFLTAAARAMRGVPGLHVPRVLQSLQVMVADDRRAITALGPVAAGGVDARRGAHSRRIRAG